jgi:hypothetical protein
MATTAQIEDALTALGPGTKVCLKLKNGSELIGVIADARTDTVVLEDADAPVEVDQIETVLMDVESEGPE